MIYKMLPKIDGEKQIFARIDDDEKCRLTCSQDDANFKKAINEETAELQDADGNVMSAEEAKAFVATLPA